MSGGLITSRIGSHFTNNSAPHFALTGADAPAATLAYRVIAASTCNIVSISQVFNTVTGVCNVRASLYSDNNGSVGALIPGTEGAGINPVSGVVNTINLAAATPVTERNAYWVVLKNYAVGTTATAAANSFSSFTYPALHRSAVTSVADTWTTYNYERTRFAVNFSDGYTITGTLYETGSYASLTSDSHYVMTRFLSPSYQIVLEGVAFSFFGSAINAGALVLADITVNGKTYTTIPTAIGAYNGTYVGAVLPLFYPITILPNSSVSIKLYMVGITTGTLFVYYSISPTTLIFRNTAFTIATPTPNTYTDRNMYLQLLCSHQILNPPAPPLNRRKYINQR